MKMKKKSQQFMISPLIFFVITSIYSIKLPDIVLAIVIT